MGRARGRRGMGGVGAVVAGGLVMAVAHEAAAQDLQAPPPMGPYWGQPASPPPQGMGPSSGTQTRLRASEQEDSGRGLELVYLNADLGASYVTLGGSVAPDHAGAAPVVGVGAGVRFIFWTLGARVRAHFAAPFTLWQVNGEAGFHLPLGPWDPYATLRGGYVTTSVSSDVGPSSSATPRYEQAPRGWDLGLALGADYYASRLVSFGGELSVDALFMNVSQRLGSDTAAAGTEVGLAAAATAHVGLHFGL